MTLFRGNTASRPARVAVRTAGFTLIEVMIAIAVVGILTAIALPQYNEFVRRSRIVDATSTMNDFRTRMEQFFQDNRTYLNAGNCGVALPPAAPAPGSDPSASFDFGCVPTALGLGYTITASGRASKGMGSFVYTLAVADTGVVTRGTSGAPVGWNTAPPCWVTRKNGECS